MKHPASLQKLLKNQRVYYFGCVLFDVAWPVTVPVAPLACVDRLSSHLTKPNLKLCASIGIFFFERTKLNDFDFCLKSIFFLLFSLFVFAILCSFSSDVSLFCLCVACVLLPVLYRVSLVLDLQIIAGRNPSAEITSFLQRTKTKDTNTAAAL